MHQLQGGRARGGRGERSGRLLGFDGRFGIRHQESGIKGIRNQKSEVRNQESEVVNPSATTAHNLFKVVLCRAGLTEFINCLNQGVMSSCME
jgi:hypothetical protein